MFEVGEDYCILTGGTPMVGKIVNTYEEAPNKWVLIIKEPQTGTLLKRYRFIRRTPKLSTGGNN